MRGADAIVCSFAGYSSLLPSLLGRAFNVKVFIVLHGTECASIPSISYGMTRKFLLRRIIGLSLRLCDRIIISNGSLLSSQDSYSGLVGTQGVLQYFRVEPEKVMEIPIGFDHLFWQRKKLDRPVNSVVSVILPGQEKRRDLPMLLKVADAMPNWRFTIIGLQAHDVAEEVPENVRLQGLLSQERMVEQFSMHRFFLQLSLYEGFGCAMAEAMLCGCIPIGTDVNAVPAIVGNTGHVIAKRNEQLIIETLAKAAEDEQEQLAGEARERIVRNYSLLSRSEKLVGLISLT